MTTATLPEAATRTDVKPELSWHVLLYNDDVHAFEDVILWVQKAAGCSLDEAIAITLEAHSQGRAVAYRGDKTDCERVCGALRSHGLQAEIDSAGEG